WPPPWSFCRSSLSLMSAIVRHGRHRRLTVVLFDFLLAEKKIWKKQAVRFRDTLWLTERQNDRGL
ncbi:hypothetical protein A2U01_0105523, partial [Trifolium medium]|nr:hypothetical protein [Trifolium medium]